MLIEGEVSSRRQIKNDFERANNIKLPSKKSFTDFINAFLFVLKKKEVSISNLFTLYSIISEGRITKKDKLKDGQVFRSEPVIISSNKLGGDYEGFDANNIKESLNNLFIFMKNRNYDIYLRAIVGHIYFEMIHPFYDFNGRTGRFLPL